VAHWIRSAFRFKQTPAHDHAVVIEDPLLLSMCDLCTTAGVIEPVPARVGWQGLPAYLAEFFVSYFFLLVRDLPFGLEGAGVAISTAAAAAYLGAGIMLARSKRCFVPSMNTIVTWSSVINQSNGFLPASSASFWIMGMTSFTGSGME